MVLMNRAWYIVDWNLRGINSQRRWDEIRAKADESNCHIMCFQETKREHFDHACIRNFCPRRINQFAYSPSIGNSGGIITLWNGNMFDGTVIQSSKFQLTVQLICKMSARIIYITNVYAPTIEEEREVFLNWLHDVDTSLMEFWIILGDFNLMRSPDNRNRPGGDIGNMMRFNQVIQHLDLEEIPLKGRAFTWSNMQDSPLLEKLDWIFTTSNWISTFPNTIATPMANLFSDHVPILISIGTDVPKTQIFRFEEYWLEFDGLKDVVVSAWHSGKQGRNSAQDITARLKSLRQGIKNGVKFYLSWPRSYLHATM